MRQGVLAVLLVLSCVSTTRPVVASPLRAGISVVEITPPVGTHLACPDKRRLAEKVHDPLFARVLVLKTPETSVALVVSDLYKLQSPTLVKQIRDELGIAHTILVSSHTRAAPSLDSDTPSNWSGEIEAKILQAAKQATGNLFSAKILFGQGALMGAHNIRVFQDDGSVQDRWANPKEEGTAPIDPAVRVIRIDQEGAGPKAILVHYSCQPAVLGVGNREISADYPGTMSRHVEKEFGQGVTCFFLGGASANIYPFQPGLQGPEGFSELDRMGQRLGREVVRVARVLNSRDWENHLQVEQQELVFKSRWDPAKKIEFTLSTVLLNRGLALVAVPGNLFLEFQMLLNVKSPVISLVLNGGFSGGNSWAGTIPPIIQAAEGGFGASYATDIEVGAGEAIIDRAVIGLYRFFGKLDDLPRGILVNQIPDLASP